MSYYSDVAFVIGFDDKEKLTAWLCAVVLDMQEQVEWYGTEENSAGFNHELALIDVFRTGAYRYYNNEYLDKQHTFVIESQFKNLPFSVERRFTKFIEMAVNTGGGGGYVIVGEDLDDRYTCVECLHLNDYFELIMQIKRADEDFTFDGGELLKSVLGE